MKRVVLLGLLLAAGSISMAAVDQQTPEPPSAKALEIDKIRDNLFVLRNQDSGGNTAVLVTASGVVVVDTKNPGWGQPIAPRSMEPGSTTHKTTSDFSLPRNAGEGRGGGGRSPKSKRRPPAPALSSLPRKAGEGWGGGGRSPER